VKARRKTLQQSPGGILLPTHYLPILEMA
jgi:hypothetical protein